MRKATSLLLAVTLSGAIALHAAPAHSAEVNFSPTTLATTSNAHLINEANVEAIYNSFKEGKSGNLEFDVKLALKNGVPEELAYKLESNIKVAQKMSPIEQQRMFSRSMQTAGLTHDQWGCLLALVKATGINFGSLVGIFMTSGWGAVVLISGVAMANAEVIHACFRNGKAIL